MFNQKADGVESTLINMMKVIERCKYHFLWCMYFVTIIMVIKSQISAFNEMQELNKIIPTYWVEQNMQSFIIAAFIIYITLAILGWVIYIIQKEKI